MYLYVLSWMDTFDIESRKVAASKHCVVVTKKRPAIREKAFEIQIPLYVGYYSIVLLLYIV